MTPSKPQGPSGSDEKNPQGQSQSSSGQQQQAASGAGGQYGEGNYEAARQYNKGLKDHVEHHDIEKEARDAAPRSADEEREMLDAEREGRSRARGSEETPGKDDSPAE